MSDASADDDLLDHYDFDFHQAKPNRFAAALRAGRSSVSLEPEAATRCSTSEDANQVLKTLLDSTMPLADKMSEPPRD